MPVRQRAEKPEAHHRHAERAEGVHDPRAGQARAAPGLVRARRVPEQAVGDDAADEIPDQQRDQEDRNVQQHGCDRPALADRHAEPAPREPPLHDGAADRGETVERALPVEDPHAGNAMKRGPPTGAGKPPAPVGETRAPPAPIARGATRSVPATRCPSRGGAGGRTAQESPALLQRDAPTEELTRSGERCRTLTLVSHPPSRKLQSSSHLHRTDSWHES